MSSELDGLSAEELQRRMDAKRDQIAQTVDELKHTVRDEVQMRKTAVRNTFDWKYQYKRNPTAFMLGASALGLLVGRAIGKRLNVPEPDYRDRIHDSMAHLHDRWDELRGKPKPSIWADRTNRAVSSLGHVLMAQAAKTAQNMIIPTVVAAITGKMASDNKTTVVEKNVHPTPPGYPDREVTTAITEIDDSGEVKRKL